MFSDQSRMGDESILSSSRDWKMLETRSTSFPHTRSIPYPNIPARENRVHPSMATIGHGADKKSKGGMMRAWASNLSNRTPFGMSSFAAHSPTHSPSQSRLRKRPTVRRTPVLTLALLKLDENLREFCQLLQDPTYENVQKACGILESSVATASSLLDHAGNHVSVEVSPTRTSPSLSPLTSWFTGASHPSTSSPTSSAVALEGEWEKFSNPLIVFAGLEGIYASLLHAESSELARSLSKLYERTIEDLSVVRETLCDPFLPSSLSEDENPLASVDASIDGSGSNKLLSYRENAIKVASSLDAIKSTCQCRRKMLWQQRELWSSADSVNLHDASTMYQSLLPLVKEIDTTSHANPISTNLTHEVEAWYHLMEMALSIEQLR